MAEDANRLVLDEFNSTFITYDLEPGIYTFKDFSEILLKKFKPEYEGYHNAIDIDFDDTTMKTKLVVKSGIEAIRLDEKSFLKLSWVSTHIGIINTIMNTLVRKL